MGFRVKQHQDQEVALGMSLFSNETSRWQPSDLMRKVSFPCLFSSVTDVLVIYPYQVMTSSSGSQNPHEIPLSPWVTHPIPVPTTPFLMTFIPRLLIHPHSRPNSGLFTKWNVWMQQPRLQLQHLILPCLSLTYSHHIYSWTSPPTSFFFS